MATYRQLAAIMFTDIVGYTALMGKDTAKALELVRISKEIQKPLVEKHNGQWLKEMGDGALVMFGTALDAVSCAIDIQELARAKFDGMLRIGIHSGDITIENDDIYGDGVNVASRLESIADPGGIYISESIEKAIQGQVNVQVKYLGELKLKNVVYGVRTYAIQGLGLPVPEVRKDKELSGHFWAEIGRRGILRVATTYILVTLLLVLLFSEVRNLLVVPELLGVILTIVLIVGLPAALFIAWQYERSPEGFVRTNSKQSWQNTLKPSQRKPLTSSLTISIMALIIVVMYFYPRFLFNPVEGSADIHEVTSYDRSIAVLPFINMSGEPEQEALCDGLTDEIIHHLSLIKSFDKVISRSSVMSLKNSDKTLPEKAMLLKVNFVLEGSFQQSGDQIKITAKLIDAVTDNHIWSEIYERQFGEIFEIQSDIAKNIAGKFKAEITRKEEAKLDRVPTENPEAYIYWKKGLYAFQTSKNFQVSINLLKKAVKTDPGFAEAYAHLAYTYLIADLGYLGDKSILVEDPLPLVQKALDLEPELGSAYMILAAIKFWKEWNFLEAEIAAKKAVELGSSTQYDLYGEILIKMGRAAEAVQSREKAVQLDPTTSLTLSGLAEVYFYSGQSEKTIETLEEYESLFQNISTESTGQIYLYLNNFEKAIENLERAVNSLTPRFISCLALSYIKTGQDRKAHNLVNQLKQMSEEKVAGSPEYFTALFYSGTGQKKEALFWLDKAYNFHNTELTWLKVDPMFEPIHDDPHYQELLRKIGFPE